MKTGMLRSMNERRRKAKRVSCTVVEARGKGVQAERSFRLSQKMLRLREHGALWFWQCTRAWESLRCFSTERESSRRPFSMG